MSGNFYDDFEFDSGDGFLAVETFYAWSEGGACQRCQSGNMVVLQHGVALDTGYSTGALTRPFLGVQVYGVQGWDDPWTRVDDDTDVTTINAWKIGAFAASTTPNSYGGVVWWRIEGFVDGMQVPMFQYQCRECGFKWSVTDQ